MQLVVMDSKSIINYGTNMTIKITSEESKEYFDIVNIDYYNAILGTPFLRNSKSWLTSQKIVLKLKAI